MGTCLHQQDLSTFEESAVEYVAILASLVARRKVNSIKEETTNER